MASLKNLLLTTTPVTPVSIANGGTGATDAATARANLGATGTVSSVGLSLPATFTVSNSPVTGAGTLTAVWASQTANQVLAAPNGASGTPTFRALVAADIPTLNQNTTGTAANVTGTVAIANGGTGQTTQQAALNAIAGAVTSGSYLRGNGTNVVMSTIQASDIPTLNQNTTGTAANVTGIVAIANGGTGSSTKQAAFNALSPLAVAGDILYHNGTNNVALNAGTSGTILVSQGAGAPTWTNNITVAQSKSVITNISAGTNLDCSLGTYFIATISANTTYTVSNVPSGFAYALVLEVNHNGGSITWWSGVKWPGDIAPTLTTGKTHLFVFITDDGGTTWRGASLVDYVQ